MNAATLHRGARGLLRGRPDGWTLLALVASALISGPIVAVVLSFAVPAADVWAHLGTTVLPRYIENSVWLMLGVGTGVTLLGVGTAWLVTMTRFPGVRFFEWGLILPLAMPAYVIGYTYTGLLDFAGPVQTTLRVLTGWSARDYWFPDIRSLGGACVVMTLVFYPYVYLLARSAFLDQSVCTLEASRTLGRSAWRTFTGVALPLARPAIMAGVALALMETLADFGTVQYFGIDTFTTGIYRTWLGLGQPWAAAQLAAILLAFVLALLVLERRSRGERRYHHTTAYYRRLPAHKLRGAVAGAAILACAVPVAFGFAVPASALVTWGLRDPNAIVSPDFLRIAGHTVVLGAVGAAATVACALLLAYARRLRNNPAVRGAVQFATLGYAVPGPVIAVGIMLPFIWIDQQLDTFARAAFGVSTGLLLSGTIFAVSVAYVVRFLAVAYGPVEAALGRITPSMDGAARVLGAGPGRTLREVHVPLATGGVLTAVILVVVEVMKELPATLILRPFNFDTLAIQTYQLASDERLAEAALPALAIVVVGLIPVVVLSNAVARSRPGHG